MNAILAIFDLPQPDGTRRVVSMEIPQRTGDEGLQVFDMFLKRYGPPPAPDPHFDAVLADDRRRRAKAEKQVDSEPAPAPYAGKPRRQPMAAKKKANEKVAKKK